MSRSKPYATRAARGLTLPTLVAASSILSIATIALPAAARAQDNRPVVVVFAFTNSSIGAGAADYAGVQTGIQDLLITDLAANNRIRLVDRERVSQVLQEQKMVKDQQIDPQTAVRLGRIMGAQYAITGGFMAAGNGQAVLNAYTIDMETTQIGNPQKIQGSTSDVMGLIGQLSSKLASTLNLAPKSGAGRRTGDDGVKNAPAQSGAPAESNVEQFAKPVSEKAMKVKLDPATLKVYSSALDEADKKNRAKATDLFKQVLAKYPDFEQAQRELDRISH
jgi:TolB-like protein